MELKLDPNSFHELAPVDQGLALLALLWMTDNNVSLEDIMETDNEKHERPASFT